MSDKPTKYSYNINDDIPTKVRSIAKKVYGTDSVEFSPEALKNIAILEKNNLDKQYICMSKTHISITDNPKLLVVPEK
jgi:formate--tetrahydrofolate ligase